MTDRWFEDFKPGDTFVTGGATLTESSILDFALAYELRDALKCFKNFHRATLANKPSSTLGGYL